MTIVVPETNAQNCQPAGVLKTPPRLVRSMPTVKAPATRVIKSLEDLVTVYARKSEITWLVPGLLAEGSLNLLSAESGIGKSWLAYYIAGAVATGMDIFGVTAERRPVLYCDGENPIYNINMRLDYMGIDPCNPYLMIGTAIR